MIKNVVTKYTNDPTLILAKSVEKNAQWRWRGSWFLSIQSAIVCQKKLWICLCHFMDLRQKNSAMRHIRLQSDASLAWNSRHGYPLGCLILIGAQLKNGLNTWYSVVEATDPNALPLSMLPTRLMCIPHALPMVVPSMNPLVTWRVHYSEKRRTLSTRYTGISFCMCRHPRGELIGCWTCLETKWGLASLYRCIVVCQMSLQSSRREWAPTRLSLDITNDPQLWLYMISRGYSVLCVKTLLYFLIFISW